MIQCPDCNSPVNRHDIYVELNQIYCRRACGGVNQDVPNLAKLELPPPVRIRKPKGVYNNIILTRSKNNGIELEVRRSGMVYGFMLIALGLLFIWLGYVLAFTNLFDRSQPVPTFETMPPALLAFAACFPLLGIFFIGKAVWEIMGGYRARIDIEGFHYGKLFGKIWFKSEYRINQLVEIRKTLRIISSRKWESRIGFFLQDKPKPFVPNWDMKDEVVNWLVYEFYKVWKHKHDSSFEEADFGEV